MLIVLTLADIDVIKRNFDEYSEMADISLSRKKFNSAVTLYYKALVELCDIELMVKAKRIGANHTERFDILKGVSPELYDISSKLFRYYRDSYNKEMSPMIAKLFKSEVEHAKSIVFAGKKS